MEPILLPSKIRFTHGERANEGIMTVEPCAQGYGTTLGNAMRRVLLSSLPGAAVTAVKIKGAEHEFSTLPNVKEDVLEIILNLKLLRLRLFSEEPVKLTLTVKGEKEITAGDFAKDAQVEIVNPDLHLATLTNPSGAFEMEVWVGAGRGYYSTEQRIKEKLELGTIAIDSLYSPVLNVSYKVEATRVGEKTDFDKLILKIETDGTLDPLEAAKQAVTILLDYVNILKDLTYAEEASN
ncbi:MAG: DNA-directed RNA polymerase subunit alpha [Candidatus Uhrbacteria bacterium]|nr:DNA-directed RNA polymerase subunit alpha [Candidatus Uhrbacteria bacterium]